MSFPSVSVRTKSWITEILIAADLDGQYDILHDYINAALDGTTGHSHSGGISQGPKIDLTAGVTGVLPTANGGTGFGSLSSFFDFFNPIGTIYTNKVNSTNPGTLFGFGTWVAITDSMLIGLGTTYATPGGTGGASTVTIAQANLPSANGTFTRYDGNGSGLTGVQGTTNGASASTQNVALGGSGTALNVMNPYTTVYMWVRTA